MFTQRKKIESSSVVVTSVHSSAIMLKWEAWRSRFSKHSSAHKPTASTNSTTATLDVKVAFNLALSRNPFKSSAPQLTIRSISSSKFVVWGMWRRARKWVQRIRALNGHSVLQLFLIINLLELLND